jgi:Caspase domain
MLSRLFLAGVLLALASAPSTAAKRVALIIGNGAYERAAQLPNPSRDAAAIGKLMRQAGFDSVEVKTDLGVTALRRALREFSDTVVDADIAVLFYAGHGIEVSGVNYLIPVDAVLAHDMDVEDEAVSLDRVGQIMSSARRLQLVILDACRDNPFVGSMTRKLTIRSIGRGLTRVEVPSSDTLVAYAAKAGFTAADGDGVNSPYTTALVKHVATPGLDIRLALGRVRDEVLQATAKKQEPYVYGSLGGAEISLVADAIGGNANIEPPAAAPPIAATGVARDVSKNAVRLFSWQTLPTEFDPGMRYWSRQANGTWIERYANGKQDRFVSLGRTKVDVCEGALLAREGERNFEVFVPDLTCPTMLALWRRDNGTWFQLGAMQDVQ